MMAPEPEKRAPKKEEMKTKTPQKEWKPFLVVDHGLRPQGFFNDAH